MLSKGPRDLMDWETGRRLQLSLAPSLGIYDIDSPLPSALAGPPCHAHIIVSKYIIYIFKNLNTTKHPGGPWGSKSLAHWSWGRNYGTGEPLCVLPSWVVSLLMESGGGRVEVPCSRDQELTPPSSKMVKERSVWKCAACMSRALGVGWGFLLQGMRMLGMWLCLSSA